MKYGRVTRVLHLLIAIGISLQLLLSLVMEAPRPGHGVGGLEAFTFEAHEFVGIAVLAILVVHWLMFVTGNAHKGWLHFFPWFSAERVRAVFTEVGELVRFKVGDPEVQDSLAGAIQGLGLVVASLLAVTGTVVFFGMADDGSMSAAVHAVKEFHEFWGPVMWGYLVLHIGAVMLHRALGHRSVLGIFRP